MKVLISYLVMAVPIYAVIFWARDRFKSEPIRIFGLAFAASGLALFVGTKFFDLYVVGKKTVSKGEDAVRFSLIFLSSGVILVIAHYLLFVPIRSFWNRARIKRKTANQASHPTPAKGQR